MAKLHVEFCFHKHGLSGTRRDPSLVCSPQWSLASPLQTLLKGSPPTSQQPRLPLGLAVLFPSNPLPGSEAPPAPGPASLAFPSSACAGVPVRAHAWGRGGWLGWSSALARKPLSVGKAACLLLPSLSIHQSPPAHIAHIPELHFIWDAVLLWRLLLLLG